MPRRIRGCRSSLGRIRQHRIGPGMRCQWNRIAASPRGERPVLRQNYPHRLSEGARNSTNGESLPLRGIGPGRRMATCSNGHPTSKNEMRCRMCEASLVGLNPRQLASTPTAEAGQAAPYSLPGAGSTRLLPPRAAGLLLAVIAAAICVAVTLATSDSRVSVPGYSSSARLGPLSARPNQSSANDRAANGATRSAPRGTDLQGFLGYPEARCNSANPAVAIGRTPKSLVVICEDYDGRFYFKGLGLTDGHSVKLENFVLVEDQFTASSSGVRCLVSPLALTITRGPATIANEPMLEYWSV
jgi:hypothetical protein